METYNLLILDVSNGKVHLIEDIPEDVSADDAITMRDDISYSNCCWMEIPKRPTIYRRAYGQDRETICSIFQSVFGDE